MNFVLRWIRRFRFMERLIEKGKDGFIDSGIGT